MKTEKLTNQFFASCPTGLEEVLFNELKELGINDAKQTHGGSHFSCEANLALKVIIHSRTASRVFKKYHSFEIKIEKDIYFCAKEIKWKAIFDLDQTFKIYVLQGKSPLGTKRSKFRNSMYLGQVLKDAIVDRFREDTKERPSVDKDNPDISLYLRVEPNDNPHSEKEDVTILADLCGDSMGRRGYRVSSVKAPVRENLAAGLVLMSDYNKDKDLYDPMCGSGTFIIESLLVKGNIPPSFLKVRDYFEDEDSAPWDFLNHNFYVRDKDLIEKSKEMLEEAKKQIEKGLILLGNSTTKTYGCDSDYFAVKATQDNLHLTGLSEFAIIEKREFQEKIIEGFKGTIITNPPYGERLGEEEELGVLYYDLGEMFKNKFKESNAFVLTGNLNLIKKIQLKTKKKHIIYNGNLESRFVQYELF